MKLKKISIILLFFILFFIIIAFNNKENLKAEDKIIETTESFSENNIIEELDKNDKLSTEIKSDAKEETQLPTILKEEITNIINTEETSSTESTSIEKDNLESIEEIVIYEEVNETVYSIASLNIRKGPDIKYEKIAILSYGESIKRIGIGNNGWSKLEYNNSIVYANSSYLTTEKPEEKTNETVNIEYPLSYTDDTCTITIYKEWYENAWCYAAHLEFSDYSRFGTSCANGSYNNGTETTSNAAKRLNAIFAVNGCYSSPNLNYPVARNGQVWNDKICGVPGVYSNQTGLFQSAWDTGGTDGIKGVMLSELVTQGLVTDTFCFGPPILINSTVSSSADTSRAQRTFMGTNGNAGDIWIVVSDGRKNDNESTGLTYKQMSQYLLDKGCTFGIPLDGGGSSTMYFNGTVLNAANGNERAVVDFVYFK